MGSAKPAKLGARISAAALVFALTAPSAASATSVKGRVVGLFAHADLGLRYVKVEGALVGRPACAAQTEYFMIKGEGTPIADSQFAMLMSAHLTGRKVTVHGTGTCTRWGDGEDVAVVTFE